MSEVRVGSIWADNDKRSEGRKVRVVEVDATHATVEPAATPGRRRTRIRLDRFRPTATGYRLVEDVATEPARPRGNNPACVDTLGPSARAATEAVGR